MKNLAQLFFIASLLFSGRLMAYDFAAGSIDLPEGFVKTQTKNVLDQGVIHEFVKQHPQGNAGTLLQITVYDFGQKLRPVPDSMLLAAAEDHLMDYIAGQRRGFDSFEFNKMPSIKIDNTPTAHIEWTASRNGQAQHGAAFCLMKSSRVVMLQVKDISDAPLDNTIEALKALTAIKLKN